MELAVRRTFPQRNQRKALATLHRYLRDLQEIQRERMVFAILRLAQGDLEQLQFWVARARRDWQEVILAAEGPSLFRAHGMPIPRHRMDLIDSVPASTTPHLRDRNPFAWSTLGLSTFGVAATIAPSGA